MKPEKITIEKTYGIKKIYNGRWAVVTEISMDKKHYYVSDTLHYVNAKFATKKAEAFLRACYKDFINFQGIPIHYIFKNMGIIDSRQINL